MKMQLLLTNQLMELEELEGALEQPDDIARQQIDMKVPDAVGHALTRDLKYEREEDSLCLIF